jgi:hypothetical protein
LYGFNRYEALRSFRKASELDSRAAMPYWGIARTPGPHINMDGDGDVDLKASCEALQAGLGLTTIPEAERAYLEAAAKRCPAYEPGIYTATMKALATRYPDEVVLAGGATHPVALTCHNASNLAVSADHVAPLRIDSRITVGYDHLRHVVS